MLPLPRIRTFLSALTHRDGHAAKLLRRPLLLLVACLGLTSPLFGSPAVTAVHGITSAGTKIVGDTFTIRVTFSDTVVVTGTPTLTLETGDVDRVIHYESGSGTTQLFFRYTVQLGDTSPDLDYVSTTALALNGGTIRDAEGNDATLTLPAPGSSGSLAANEAFVIDARGAAPTGLALSSTRIHERMAVARAAIGIFSTTDSDSGDTHTYTLVAGEGDTHNSSFAIDGDALLVAVPHLAVGDYAVRVRTTDVGDNTLENSFTLTVSDTPQTDAGFNRANPEHWFPTTTGKYSIATWEPAIGERGEGIYTIELEIEATGYWPGREGFIYGIAEIPFSDTSFHDLGAKPREWGFRGWEGQKAVESTVSDFGSIFKEIGERIRLHFDTRTGTLSLYTKRAGDTDFSLEGGAPLVTGIEVAEGKKLHFAVSGIAWQPAGVSVVGETFPNAAPTDITLSSATIAQSVAAAGATVGTFTSADEVGDAHVYALVPGEGDTHNSSFVIDGATLKLGASTLAPGTYSLRVKTTDARGANFEKVISVTVAPPAAVAVHGLTTAGTKGSGSSFLIRVTFSDAVVVTGVPQLTLETGAIDRVAHYESGSGTTYLEFRYTVRPGDSSPDLDYVSADALALAGGTIRDAAGNDATLTLPAPGETGSLSANGEIRIAAAANNAPRDLYLSSNTLFPADAVAGALVGTLHAVDSEYGDVHTYSVVGGEGDTHNASFVLDGGTLKIADSALTAGVYSVRIRTTDANDATFEKALTVAISGRLVTGVDSLAANGTYRNGDTFLVRITYSDVVFVTGTPTLTLKKLQASNVTLQGAVDAFTTTVAGTVLIPNQSPIGFAGLETSTARTDRLVGLSSRGRVGTGEKILISGLVIGGSQPKQVLIRAIGPSLVPLGVADVLADPQIRVFKGSTIVAENNDWGSNPSPADIAAVALRVGAFAVTSGSKDAILVTTLQPGAYTVHVSGGEGVALAEIYDASENPQSEYQRLIDISTRGEVGTGENVLIGGLVITGNSPKKVLIRGVGPSLAAQGVAGPLADPVLKVFRGAVEIAQNDNWSDDLTAAAAVTAAETATGAFHLESGSKDAALLMTLAPGLYTVHVAGANNTTGVALVEIYEVPE